jgi:hypothetical protein
MFELTSPYNKIIVPYRETKLTLLGCRDEHGIEHTPEWVRETFKLGFETPAIYPLKTIDEVIAYCESIDSNNREGKEFKESPLPVGFTIKEFKNNLNN